MLNNQSLRVFIAVAEVTRTRRNVTDFEVSPTALQIAPCTPI
jgi:hypothetical protein